MSISRIKREPDRLRLEFGVHLSDKPKSEGYLVHKGLKGIIKQTKKTKDCYDRWKYNKTKIDHPTKRKHLLRKWINDRSN